MTMGDLARGRAAYDLHVFIAARRRVCALRPGFFLRHAMRATSMAKRRHTDHAGEQKRPMTEEGRQERKQRIQTHGRASVTRSIAHAVVVKEGDMFFLCEPDGRVPLGGEHGFGLY